MRQSYYNIIVHKKSKKKLNKLVLIFGGSGWVKNHPLFKFPGYNDIEISYGTYSTVPNCDLGADKRVGYYIGLFGYYIKNYFLFNNFFWKNPKINRSQLGTVE